MRLGVIGSRNVTSEAVVGTCLDEACDLIATGSGLVLLGGGSRGSERLAMQWAEDNKVDHVLFKPYNFVDTGTEHHPKFFFFRNKQIVDNSDYLLIFLDEKEHGVRKTLDYVREKTNKPFKAVNEDGLVLEERG